LAAAAERLRAHPVCEALDSGRRCKGLSVGTTLLDAATPEQFGSYVALCGAHLVSGYR